tara:strand:- start:934 stop:1611 length:678 start_codon:yes stop_codon:yes gene_type:complete
MNLIQELRQLDEAKKKKGFDKDRAMKALRGMTPRSAAAALGPEPDRATSPDASYRNAANAEQLRGPTPGGEGGSDVTRPNQPIARPHSNKGSVKRILQGTPPPTPKKGKKFDTPEQGQAATDFLKGKPKQKTMFESRLLEALLSNEEMLLEFTSKSYARRGHTKKMSVGKKMLIGGALAAALAAGAVGSKKKDTGPKKTQDTHQTSKKTDQGHSGTGVSAEEDDL